MPQLDTVTWFSQIVWLFISFWFLYFINHRWVLPFSFYLIKGRKRLIKTYLKKNNQVINTVKKEKSSFHLFANVIWLVYKSLFLLKKTDLLTLVYLNSNNNNLKLFFNENKKYISILKKLIVLRQNLI